MASPSQVAAQILSKSPLPRISTNSNFVLEDTHKQRIRGLLGDLKADDLPMMIVVLNPEDFKKMRANAVGRSRLPGAKANAGAFTIPAARRTFLRADILDKSDDELESVLIHEIAHLRRFRNKQPQDEVLVSEDTARLLKERRKARAKKKVRKILGEPR